MIHCWVLMPYVVFMFICLQNWNWRKRLYIVQCTMSLFNVGPALQLFYSTCLFPNLVLHSLNHLISPQFNAKPHDSYQKFRKLSEFFMLQFIWHFLFPNIAQCGWCPTAYLYSDPLMWKEIFTLICRGFCVCLPLPFDAQIQI